MSPESGNIYPSLSELFTEESKKGISVDTKNLIHFGLGDRMEIRGGAFEIVEIKPYPENIIVLHSRERGIY